MRWSEGGGKVLLHFRSGQADARATRFQKGQGGKCADSIKINPNYEQFIHLAEQPSARVRALKIFPQLCPFPPPRPFIFSICFALRLFNFYYNAVRLRCVGQRMRPAYAKLKTHSLLWLCCSVYTNTGIYIYILSYIRLYIQAATVTVGAL